LNLYSKIALTLIDVFGGFVQKISAEYPKASEKIAIQVLFDFKFVTKVIQGGLTESDEEAHGNIASIVSTLKSLIDPIDLAIVDANIVNNVDRFYFRSSTVLGSLLLLNPKPSEALSYTNGRKRNPGQNEMHNLVALAPTSNVRRFAMLPVVTPNLVDSNPSSGNENQKSKACSRVRPLATVQLFKVNAGRGFSSYNLNSKPTVLGIVNAVTSGLSIGTPDSNTSGLIFNASSFISGMWGSAAPLTPAMTKK
jgi:hypothetical protein